MAGLLSLQSFIIHSLAIHIFLLSFNLVVYNNAFPMTAGRIRESNPYAEKGPGGGKRLAPSTLASALGLGEGGALARDPFGISRGAATPGGGERFCVSGSSARSAGSSAARASWPARGSSSFSTGTKSQVFLDFFELEDAEDGLYAAVDDAMSGAGVPDFSGRRPGHRGKGADPGPGRAHDQRAIRLGGRASARDARPIRQGSKFACGRLDSAASGDTATAPSGRSSSLAKGPWPSSRLPVPSCGSRPRGGTARKLAP